MVRAALPGLAVALLLALPPGASAQDGCECLWRGSFVDVQAGTDLVASATVVGSKGNSIDIQVTQVLRGEPPAAPVRVWLHTANYCRPPVSDFPVDSQWVFALHRIDQSVPGGFNPSTPNISYGRIGDYELSSCGGYWLRQTGNQVTGNLVDAPRWARDPDMNPVLLDLVAAFVNGDIGPERLLAASREDPALKELILDTRAFLRDGQ